MLPCPAGPQAAFCCSEGSLAGVTPSALRWPSLPLSAQGGLPPGPPCSSQLQETGQGITGAAPPAPSALLCDSPHELLARITKLLGLAAPLESAVSSTSLS